MVFLFVLSMTEKGCNEDIRDYFKITGGEGYEGRDISFNRWRGS